MSKEETLRKNIGLTPFATMDAEQGKCILEAMDEWGEINAIEFIEWYRNSEYLYKWNLGNALTDTRELYILFQQYKSKQ